jgi:glycosidase
MRRARIWMNTMMLTLALNAHAAVERVEPPHWWVGMQEPTLQLVIEGPGVAALQARLDHPGVSLESSQRGDSANYLFLQLRIAPGARPGPLAIELLQDGRPAQRVSYELRERAPGSAQRPGFGTRDVVYLLVPDRFAQGGSAVREPDRRLDLSDKVDRRDPDARHGGDIEGIRQRLDYIAGMGFTQIWPTPLTENAQPRYSYHGYAITDPYRIDPRFGTLDDYKRLATEARAKGIGLIHDIVLNHIGVKHRWVADPPTRDWINEAGTRSITNHAHISVQDPHGAASDREGFVNGWFDSAMPDLNTRQPLLATYLIQNTLWWIEEVGLSGIRQDTYSYADKDFLARWSARVMAEYPRLGLVGEEMSDHAPMVAYWQRGQMNHDGYRSSMPSMMDFPLLAALRKALTTPEGHQQGWYQLYEALGLDFVYPDASKLMLFPDNHDTLRMMAAVKGDEALARMAYAFVATAPRIPQFFTGDEFGWRGPDPKHDGVLRQGFPGGWAGDAKDGVSGRGLTESERGMQDWLRRLLTWRQGQPLVHGGKLLQYVPRDGAYVYFRHDPLKAGRVMVVLHKGSAPLALKLDRFIDMVRPGQAARDVLAGRRFTLGDTLPLAPRSVTILEIDTP